MADADLVALSELPGREIVPAFGRQIALGAFADFVAIDEGAIAAAEIAHFDGGRIDFKLAMVPGYVHVRGIHGKADITIVRPADDRSSRRLKDKFLVLTHSFGDGEFDFLGHRSLLPENANDLPSCRSCNLKSLRYPARAATWWRMVQE